jgi:hypothetical protein
MWQTLGVLADRTRSGEVLGLVQLARRAVREHTHAWFFRIVPTAFCAGNSRRP